MKRLLSLLIVALLAGVAQPGAEQNDAALDKLFASAQHKAAVEANLKGAIEDYKKIVASAGSNRAAAVQALLHIAECHHKLNDTDAERQAYRQILSDYSDQKTAVATARAHVGVLESTTLVWDRANVDVYGGLNTNARVSRDGGLIAYTDWSTGNLVLRDLNKQSGRNLTTDGNLQRNVYAQSSAFSPDGRQIAFSWLSAATGRYQVRLVSATAPGEPRVIFDQEDVEWVQPYDWSLDGKRIALQIRRVDRTGQIALLNVEDGMTRVLASFPWVGQSGEMRFSPDGRHLAFDQPTERDAAHREVFVIPSDGSCCNTAVVENPADEQVLGWGPTGSELLFWSDRKGPWTLWTIGIGNGKPSSSARPVDRVKVNGAFAPLGLTSAGDVMIASLRIIDSGIRTVQVDLATGRLTSMPIDLGPDFANPFYGWTSYAWAPTGQTLTVFRRSETNGGVFSFKDFARGTLREVRVRDAECPGGMQWSSDGRFLVCHGVIKDPQLKDGDGAGIVRVDLLEGKASYVAAGRAPSLSRDDRTVYLLRPDNSRGEPQTVVIEHQLASGAERELLRRRTLRGLRLSPDGQQLVAITGDAQSGVNSLLVVPLDGAEAREVFMTPGAGSITGVFWSADSRALFAQRSAPSETSMFVRVTLDGQVTIQPALDLGLNVQVHADGRHVAYSGPKKSVVEVHRIPGVTERQGLRR